MNDRIKSESRLPTDDTAGRIDSSLGALLRLWAQHGWDDRNGGLHERLTADHRPIELGYRRLTTCARQLYVFAAAAKRGLLPGAQAHADRIFRYLTDRFWDKEHGGFFHRVDLAGAPADRTKDLYGHAFALFALAHYCAASDENNARNLLARTDRVIADRFLLSAGWYAPQLSANWSTADTRLLQNPHMHLLEAYLAAYEISGDRELRDRAEFLIALARSRLIDRATGTIIEFRGAGGEPDPVQGHVVEPGHHFEWCWLLHAGARAFGEVGLRADASRLFDWAVEHGVDRQHGGVFDQVSTDGTVVADTKRIWPFAEYIKARAVRCRDFGRSSERAALDDALAFFFVHYLLPDGGWRERLRRNLECYDDELPGTTSYHVLLALMEARAAITVPGP